MKTQGLANKPSSTALVLSGGGARAAYQVGVLAAIADLLPNEARNPFGVIVGTSAGAINAVSLACGALQFQDSVRRLAEVWRGFRSDQVYHTDWPRLLRQASRFIRRGLLGLGSDEGVGLLNNEPLRELLNRELDFSGIAAAVRAGHLRAVAISAFAYDSGQAVTFYQGKAQIDPWFRHRRVGVPTRLNVEHLMASSAIPIVFPPVKVGREYYGDGALRQSAPISPALHLGADRVLVIGVNNAPEKDLPPERSGRAPTVAQIGAQMLNSTFIDNLETDIEQLERLNRLGHWLPTADKPHGLKLRPVDVLVINPSQPLDQIAARHRLAAPRSLRTFLRGPGATRRNGAGVLSYLLFEAAYCNELIELGYQDAMAQEQQLKCFLTLQEPAQLCTPANSSLIPGGFTP